MADRLLYQGAVHYKGGHPKLLDESKGELVILNRGILYQAKSLLGWTQGDPTIITTEDIDDVVLASGVVVEIDFIQGEEDLTVKFVPAVVDGLKEGQKIVEAIDGLIRGTGHASYEVVQEDRRRPFQAKHISGLPQASSGASAQVKIYEDAIFIWDTLIGMTNPDLDRAWKAWCYRVPLDSLRSARLDTGERLVAMRVIVTGGLGLLWKKKDKFLVLEWDDPSGLNVPIVLSFNSADQALSEIQVAKAARPLTKLEVVTDTSEPSTLSVADRIRQAKLLFDDGIISEAEYETKKAKLLELL